MEDRLDVVAVRIEDERSVVFRVIVRPDARRPEIPAARTDRGRVKGLDLPSVGGREGDDTWA